MELSAPKGWYEYLSADERTFVRRFVLASGSLKEVAAGYEISYPTMRLRLDRLIEKIKILESNDAVSPFERLLRAQHADGKLDAETITLLLEAHRREAAGPSLS